MAINQQHAAGLRHVQRRSINAPADADCGTSSSPVDSPYSHPRTTVKAPVRRISSSSSSHHASLPTISSANHHQTHRLPLTGESGSTEKSSISLFRSLMLVALSFALGVVCNAKYIGFQMESNSRMTSDPTTDEIVKGLQQENQRQHLEILKLQKQVQEAALRDSENPQDHADVVDMDVPPPPPPQSQDARQQQKQQQQDQQQESDQRLRGRTVQQDTPQVQPNDWDHEEERFVRLVNQSGHSIKLYWVNGGERVLMNPTEVGNGETFGMHAHPTHVFEVQQLPNDNGDDGSDISEFRFTVSDQPRDQTVLLKERRLEFPVGVPE